MTASTGSSAASAKAVLAAAYAHGPGKSVQVTGAWQAPHRARPSGTPWQVLAEHGPLGRALYDTLTTALAPRRWEPLADHNDHRAFPSARAAHLHAAAIRLPGSNALTVIDPVRGLLTGRPPERGEWPHDATATIELSVEPQRLRPGYGPLRDAIALLETGHVLGAIAEAAAVNGLGVRCELLSAATSAALASTRAEADAADRPPARHGPVATLTVRHLGEPAWPRRRVDAIRTSGLAPRGLSADPRPLPHGVLRALTEAALRRPPGSPALLPSPGASRLRHRLLVGNTSDHPPGIYRAHPQDGDAPVVIGPTLGAPTADEVRRAFRAPATAVDVATLPVIWVITADITAAVTGSPHAYGQLLLRAGAAAQHVCTAAADAGLFSRPVRAFDEARLESIVGAAAAEDVLYALLIGRPRLPGLGYDLTDPCPEGHSPEGQS